MSSSINPPSRNRPINVGKGGELAIIDNDVDEVLSIHMAENYRLRDFVEGNWDNYDFKSFNEGFTAFYEELHRIGFTDDQKDYIFSKARIIGWDNKSRADKRLLYKEARRQIKEKKGTEKTKDEEDKLKRKSHFEKDGNLYLEILTSNEQYKYAYLNERGDVQLIDALDCILPVELPTTREGELAFVVKMPDEHITSSELLSPINLLERIKAHIRKYCDLPPLDIELCSYYVLFSWFYKKGNTVGYLRFLADTGKGKSRMLTVVSDLCFYPTSASGSGSFSGMMRFHEHWHGTLVIDEADIKGEKENQTVKYLNLGFEAEKYFLLSDKEDPKRQEVFDPFGPKILAMREPFKDNATEGRLLSISPHETTNDTIPIILDRAYYAETAQLRNEIARFVLAHWQDVDGEQMLSFKGMDIEPRLQQLAMPLSVIFQLWENGKENFRAYIQDRQKALKKDRAQSWHGSMFNLVYALAKGEEEAADYAAFYNSNGELQAITPSMVAKILNTSPKKVTDTLRSIGFEVELRYITLSTSTERELPKEKKKRVRTYVVPEERTWREIIQRYYYDAGEDDGAGTDGTGIQTNSTNFKIPVVLKSKKFDPVFFTVPSVPSVPKIEEVYENRTDGTDGTGEHTAQKIFEKNVCDLCGAEAVTTEHDGALVCEECQRRLGKEEPDFLDEEFG